MVVSKKCNLKDNKGQAVFEFIFFLSIFVMLIPMFITLSNSINSSINQQKATRRYFYFLMKGNSKLPDRSFTEAWANNGIKRASLTSIGWGQKKEGKLFSSACFKLTGSLMPDSSEDCNTKQSGLSATSGIVRVFTGYGICGTNYTLDESTSQYTSDYKNTRGTFCGVSN